MKFRKWDFYKDFSNTLKIAEYHLSLDVSINADPPVGKMQVLSTGALRGASAVLCVAAFELYLRNVFEAYVDELTSNTIVFSKLPAKMQMTSVYTTLGYCIKPPKSRGLASKPIDRINDVMSIISNIGAGRMEPWAFAITNSNPSAEQLKSMFNDLGITDPFKKIKTQFELLWGKAESDDFINDKLDEIIQRRHVVAHTANALNISRGQLRESFKFLRVLSKCVEECVYKHIKHLVKTAV